MTRLLSRAFQAARVVTRQLARNPRRTILTFFGLVISFFLYTMLQSTLATLDRLLEQYASDTVLMVGARNVRSMFLPELPRSYAATLRETDGVIAASPMRFFVGVGRNESSPVMALGVEFGPFQEIHSLDGLDAEEAERMRSERNGALVGGPLLDQNGWKVGDKVTLGTLGGSGPSLDVSIVGDLAQDDRFSAMMVVHIDYLERVLGDPGRSSFIQARIARPEYAATLGRLIDARFSNYSVPTETSSEKAHMSGFLTGLGEALGALEAIGYLTLGITVLVVANSVSMSVRERTVEIGTLRALGFSKGWILSMIVSESVLVAVLGGVAGALLALSVAGGYNSGALAPPEGPEILFVLDARVFFQVILFSIPVGALAAAQPVVSAVRMPIADALRFAV